MFLFAFKYVVNSVSLSNRILMLTVCNFHKLKDGIYLKTTQTLFLQSYLTFFLHKSWELMLNYITDFFIMHYFLFFFLLTFSFMYSHECLNDYVSANVN